MQKIGIAPPSKTLMTKEGTYIYFALHPSWQCIVSTAHTLYYSLTRFTIDIPVLFIGITRDTALPESMSAGMEKYIPQLTRKSVESSHWALWQAPGVVNGYIKDWLNATYFGATPKI
jgi:pimeloyl-ACP methyl ester carboxylesterase